MQEAECGEDSHYSIPSSIEWLLGMNAWDIGTNDSEVLTGEVAVAETTQVLSVRAQIGAEPGDRILAV